MVNLKVFGMPLNEYQFQVSELAHCDFVLDELWFVVMSTIKLLSLFNKKGFQIFFFLQIKKKNLCLVFLILFQIISNKV